MSTTCLVPVYEALAGDLQRLGIDFTFGLMSDDTSLLVTALDSMGVRFVGARHENQGVAMAEGYASASGRVGVAIIGRGPATANALHAVVSASRSSVPLLVVVGDPSNRLPDPNALGPESKTFASAAVFQAAGLRVFSASSPTSARQSLADAYAAAHLGATVLLLPMNVQQSLIDAERTAPEPVAPPTFPKREIRTSGLDAAVDLLKRSKAPLIVAGLGAVQARAGKTLEALADRLGAALATTLKAQDLFRQHPFNCGILGSFSHTAGRRLIEHADCVLAFGASLNQRTTSFGQALPPGIPVIHIDLVRGHINRWFPADISIVGDASEVADALLTRLPQRAHEEQPLRSAAMASILANYRPENEFEAQHTARTVDPRSLAITLNEMLPRDRNMVYDAGNFLQVAKYFSVPSPLHVKYTTDFSSLGLGFGTALGMSIGSPIVPTVLVVGDGGLLMSLGELETAVREDLPLVVVLMNDCAYGAELHYLQQQNVAVAKSKFPDIDFAPVAESFGFECATIRSLSDLEAIEETLREPNGHIFLDCKITDSVVAPFILDNVSRAKN